MQSFNDEQIMAMLQNPTSFERGFALLMDKYQTQVYWVARRMANNHDDASDITQNTFIKVFRALDTFKGNSKLYTWLYRIAVNETITFLQQKNRKNTTDIDSASIAQNMVADNFFDSDKTQYLLKMAIAQLPEKQRIVFNLRYYDEMPYEEMSAVLETSVGALKASFHHAVKKVENFIVENDK
jgi:RNA polymerase sigma factor (sigma-70 family)